jgi:hypothetical protein
MQNGIPTFGAAGTFTRLALNSEGNTWHGGPLKIIGVKPGKLRGPYADPNSSVVTVAKKSSRRYRKAGFQSTMIVPSGIQS